MNKQWNEAAKILTSGGVVVIPTDTIYGILANAANQSSVERVYKIKGRNFTKPCIILVANTHELREFGVVESNIKKTKNYWPGPVSVILPVQNSKLEHLTYLHRGRNSLAFRLPVKKDLHELLKQTGPLIAPSANPEGNAPAQSIDAAKAYFGKRVDFYIDEGEFENNPSQLISLLSDKPERLR